MLGKGIITFNNPLQNNANLPKASTLPKQSKNRFKKEVLQAIKYIQPIFTIRSTKSNLILSPT